MSASLNFWLIAPIVLPALAAPFLILALRHELKSQRIASTFLVTLAPKPASPYVGRGTLTLKNCNFFKVDDGRIAWMIALGPMRPVTAVLTPSSRSAPAPAGPAGRHRAPSPCCG